MAIFTQDWLDRNAGRRYPLHDGATGESDTGLAVPNNVLADLTVRLPESLGPCVYLSSLVVNDNLVSLTLLGCPSPDDAGTFTPLASLSLPQPVTEGRSYPLTSFQDGVGGWVVFGEGVHESWRGVFSGPRQSLLAPRVVRVYPSPPVLSVRKEGLAAGLKGVVRLLAGTDVEIVQEDRFIAGRARPAIIFRLRQDGGRNPFQIYTGPCGGRPETRTCLHDSIESVGGVRPDCDGDLTIEFDGGSATVAAADAGLVVDYDLGLAEACVSQDRVPDENGVLPNEYDDSCTDEFEGHDPRTPQNPDPVFPDPVVIVSSSEVPCDEMPIFLDFTADDPDDFDVESGIWSQTQSSQSSAGEEYYSSRSLIHANRTVYNRCIMTSSLGKLAVTKLRLNPGTYSNGGILINYHFTGTGPHLEFFVAELDRVTDRMRLLFYNGASYVTVAQTTPLGLTVSNWYSLEVRVTEGSSTVTNFQLDVTGVNDAIRATLNTSSSRFVPDDGQYGLHADRCETDFATFGLEELA